MLLYIMFKYSFNTKFIMWAKVNNSMCPFNVPSLLLQFSHPLFVYEQNQHTYALHWTDSIRSCCSSCNNSPTWSFSANNSPSCRSCDQPLVWHEGKPYFICWLQIACYKSNTHFALLSYMLHCVLKWYRAHLVN